MEAAIYQPFMDTLVKRVQRLMLDDEIESQRELAKRIKRSPSTVSENLKSDEDLTQTFLNQLQVKLGWSANWIRTGRGSQKIEEAKASLSDLPEQIQIKPSPQPVESHAQETDNIRLVGVHDVDVYQDVKFVSYAVWATFTDNFGDFDFYDVKQTYPVYLPRLPFTINPDRHLVFEVLGDSMEERLYERDVILTELQDEGDFEYLNSGMYVVAYRNQLVIKRIKNNDLLTNGTLTLHSDNLKHGKITIRRDDIRYIWRFVAVVYSSHQ